MSNLWNQVWWKTLKKCWDQPKSNLSDHKPFFRAVYFWWCTEVMLTPIPHMKQGDHWCEQWHLVVALLDKVSQTLELHKMTEVCWKQICTNTTQLTMFIYCNWGYFIFVPATGENCCEYTDIFPFSHLFKSLLLFWYFFRLLLFRLYYFRNHLSHQIHWIHS